MDVSLLLIMLKALLWLVAGVAGVILAVGLLALVLVLGVPVSFRGRVEGSFHPDSDENWGGQGRWEADLRWGGRLVRLRLQGAVPGSVEQRFTMLGLRLGRRKGASTNAEAPAKPNAKSKAKPKLRKKRRRPTLEEIQAYAREGLRLVKRLRKALRLHLTGDVTFGFDDPSLTGFALGAIALAGKPAGLTLRPDWFEPGAHGWLAIEGRVYGFEVAMALWQAYWRSPLSRRFRGWIPFANYGR